ncbi:hypothetical protein OGATHE_005816 [Ogataea polymorpha]|uniref:Uncharacterized protein n=1 Tax=Ogataea polymorpha TaxID=460523 RepID=A0A9P8NV20_9ASCO|nr:hypothetical protein OGATHE_005816 [Ogataea polymorpha]
MVSPKNLRFISSSIVSSSSGCPGSLLKPVSANSALNRNLIFNASATTRLNSSTCEQFITSTLVNVTLSRDAKTNTSRVDVEDENDSFECKVDLVTTGMVTPIGEGFLPTGPSFSNFGSLGLFFETVKDFSCATLRSSGFLKVPLAEEGPTGEPFFGKASSAAKVGADTTGCSLSPIVWWACSSLLGGLESSSAESNEDPETSEIDGLGTSSFDTEFLPRVFRSSWIKRVGVEFSSVTKNGTYFLSSL